LGEGELAGVEGAEVRGVEHAGGGNVQEVEGAHTQGACVILGKGFSLLPPIINRDVARGQIAFFRRCLDDALNRGDVRVRYDFSECVEADGVI